MKHVASFDTQDPDSIREAQQVLNKVVLPWAPDSSHPPRFVRVNGLGKEVAIVSSWLGGFGNTDGSDGWGYKSCPGGQGHSTSGMEATKEEAMAEIDAFLAEYFPSLTVLNDTEDAACDNPREAHGSYGTGGGSGSYGNWSLNR
jgi:hypothetical protein